MWKIFGSRESSAAECTQFRAALEGCDPGAAGGAGVDAFLASMGGPLNAHGNGCANCRQAAEELLATRVLLAPLTEGQRDVSVYFAKRVMALIAEKQQARQTASSVWSLVPRLAARLAWVSGVALLVVGTWIYEAPTNVGQDNVQDVGQNVAQNTAQGTPEYLFESPTASVSRDDALTNIAQKDQ
ncbi:MAG: hypothetical protein NVS9B4_12480 [Candidatus Acidiferrum sp.]